MALARSSCTLLPQAALALAMDYWSNAFGGAIMGGQVDQVAAERRVITPAVGVGQQFAGDPVQRHQRGNAAKAVGSGMPAPGGDIGCPQGAGVCA